MCTIFVWCIDSVMPKIRASSISEYLRRRVKVSSTVTNHPSSTFSLPYESIDTSPTSLQRHRYTQQQLLKPIIDRFNTRGRTNLKGRTIYNAFDCLLLEHQGHTFRLRLMHTSHRKFPKETLHPSTRSLVSRLLLSARSGC